MFINDIIEEENMGPDKENVQQPNNPVAPENRKVSAKKRNILIILGIFCIVALLLLARLHKQKVDAARTASLSQNTSTDTNNGTSQKVPANYQVLYDDLSSKLVYFDQQVQAHQNNTTPTTHPIFGAELLIANPNRGPALLTPQNLTATKIFIDKLGLMQVKGLEISMRYPLLTPQFPRYTEYVDYYKNVISYARSKGMIIDVESNVLFANTPFSSFTIDYSKIPFTQFESDMRQMGQTIITQFSPEYINFGSEPSTLSGLTGYKQLNDPVQFAAYIRYLTTGLQKGKTKVGAGGATWVSLDFEKQLVQNPDLDFTSLHVYPLRKTDVDAIFAIADLARTHNKELLMDEVWTYKALDTELGSNIAATDSIFKRDVYSFWYPLDSIFFKSIGRLAASQHITFVSPFWSTYFFSYITYDPSKELLSYQQLRQLSNQEAFKNAQQGVLSPLGEDYQNISTGY